MLYMQIKLFLVKNRLLRFFMPKILKDNIQNYKKYYSHVY